MQPSSSDKLSTLFAFYVAKEFPPTIYIKTASIQGHEINTLEQNVSECQHPTPSGGGSPLSKIA